MVNIKELLDLTSQSCNTRERALGSLPANRALNSDQVISKRVNTYGVQKRAPGPGLKLQAATKLVNACIDQSEPQAPSNKLQAASSKQQA